jgi:hypothetical protein
MINSDGARGLDFHQGQLWGRCDLAGAPTGSPSSAGSMIYSYVVTAVDAARQRVPALATGYRVGFGQYVCDGRSHYTHLGLDRRGRPL